MESLVSIKDGTRHHFVSIIRISKVAFRLRTFPDMGFWKGSDTQNHLYYNKNLFKSIDMMWVSFDENYFLDI